MCWKYFKYLKILFPLIIVKLNLYIVSSIYFWISLQCHMHETRHYSHLNIGFQCHDCFNTGIMWSPCVIDKILIIVTLNIGSILNYLILLWIISHSKWNFNKGGGGRNVGCDCQVILCYTSITITCTFGWKHIGGFTKHYKCKLWIDHFYKIVYIIWVNKVK